MSGTWALTAEEEEKAIRQQVIFFLNFLVTRLGYV